MSEVKWIKLYVDMFDNRKIKFIRGLPQGIDILLLWIMLLITAGKVNDDGYIYLVEDIPYTEESLAQEFDMPVNTIRLGLETFRKLHMIETNNKGLRIINWEKYQNIDGMERIRALTRERVRKFREKKKQQALPNSSESECNVTCNATVALSNAIDIDKDIDKEKDNNISPKGDISQHKKSVDHPCPYKKIVSLYHEICTSLPKVKALTDTRKRYLRARWKEHPGMDFWRELFEKVEASDFLTGRADYGNRKPFIANFEWIIRPNNFAKILEGIYDNRDSDPSFEAELLARANQLKRRREYESNF